MGSKEIPTLNHQSEKSINSSRESLNLTQFFEQTSDFYQKIESKFNPLLNKIDIHLYNQLYYGTKKQIGENTEKFDFFTDKAKDNLLTPQKITIRKEGHTQKIISVSFSWLQETKSENLFLKIKFKEEKLESIERRVKPNTIFKKTYESKKEKKYELDTDQASNNQMIKFKISYDPIRLEMTLGYLAGKQFFFIYPNHKTNDQLILSKEIKITRPNLERAISQIRKIEKEFLK